MTAIARELAGFIWAIGLRLVQSCRGERRPVIAADRLRQPELAASMVVASREWTGSNAFGEENDQTILASQQTEDDRAMRVACRSWLLASAARTHCPSRRRPGP